MRLFVGIARLITALRPWLGQLVVVGGWAHRLHRLHWLAKPPGHLLLRTRDTDLAFSPDAALAGDVRAALTDAGFTEQRFGDDSPPATHYGLGADEDAFYAEFLTPLHGSGIKRNGKPGRDRLEGRHHRPEAAIPGTAARFAVERAGWTGERNADRRRC